MPTTSRKHHVLISDDLPRVLLAGDANFLSSYLAEIFLDKSCYLTCIDNITEEEYSTSLKLLLKAKNFKFIKFDFTKSLERLDLPHFDYVFDLSSSIGYLSKSQQSLQNLFNHSQGTRNLLDLCKKHKAKFLLASSTNIYEGLISTTELKNYFGKKEDGEEYYSQAEAQRFSESLVAEYFKNYDLDCRVVRLVDIYGPGMPLNKDNLVNTMFMDLKTSQQINIKGNGKEKIYPTFVEDAAQGLLTIMLSQRSTGIIYTLANPQAKTVLELCETIQQASKEEVKVKIIENKDFSYHQTEEKEISETLDKIHWQPKVSLEKGISETLQWLEQLKIPETKTNIEEISKPLEKVKPTFSWQEQKGVFDLFSGENQLLTDVKEKQKYSAAKPTTNDKAKSIDKKIKRKFKVKIVLSILMVGFITLLVILSLPILSFYFYLNSAIVGWQKNDILKTHSSLNKNLTIVKQFGYIAYLPFFNDSRKTLTNTILNALNATDSMLKQVQAENSFYELVNLIIKAEKSDLQTKTSNLITILDQEYEGLSVLESELNNLSANQDKKSFTFPIQDKLTLLKQETPNLRKKISLARESLIALPNILAFNDKRTYLVLLQDNFELRPAGGFISSYGFLSFEKGRLLDFSLESVYNADNQLRGHVEPPELVKKNLGENNWYLRDSNWDPDFVTSSDQARWFINKELSKNTDGTIAFNLLFLKDCLEIVGPVQLSDFNETITSNNFLEKSVYYSETDNSFGLGQKDFFNQVANNIIEKIKRMDEKAWIQFLSLLDKNLEEKNFLITLNDNKASALFAKNGWDGAIRQLSTQNKIEKDTDYLMLVDANLGINKANYFLKKEISQEVSIIDENSIISTIAVVYQNKSTSNGWPQGDYKNYVRFYLPEKAKIENVRIGSVKESLENIDKKKINYFQEHGKSGIGFLLTVPVNEERIIKISYRPEMGLIKQQDKYSYLLYFQKQSGMSNDQLNIKVTYPDFLKPVKIAPEAKLGSFQINFSSLTDKDHIFAIDFKK